LSSTVLTLAAGMDTSTTEWVYSVSSSLSTPESPENVPFTCEIIICLTSNSAAEWAGSIFHMLEAAIANAGEAVAIVAVI
jgi:hypothetical protein